jgi:hypothetical protein
MGIIFFLIPLSSRTVTPLTHTANKHHGLLPRSKMRTGDDWLERQQHQHHPAACFMLAAGPAISIQLARILAAIHLQSFLSRLFHSSLTQRQRWVQRYATQPFLPLPKRCSITGKPCWKHAMPAKSLELPKMSSPKAVMPSSPPKPWILFYPPHRDQSHCTSSKS